MIIHSPIISGSLTFADGATFTMPDNGIYSGSFSGSYQGDGSSLTFGGTNIVSSSAQLSLEFLDTLGDGVVSGSSQISFNGITDKPTLVSGSSQISFNGIIDKPTLVSGSSQISYTDIVDKPTLVSGSTQVLFNDILNNPFSGSGDIVFTTNHIIPSNLSVDLGSSTTPFRDLYLSSASLYIDGTQVISSNTNELILSTDANQSLKILETGADTITLQAQNGDITLTTTGTGNIELNAPIQVAAGNQILSSDGNAIQFGEDIDVDGDLNVQGNITVTGTVDGVDIAALSDNVTAILSGSQADKDSFAEIVSLINSVDTDNDNAFASFYTSSNQRMGSLEDFTASIDTTIKSKLDSETVVSSSQQVIDHLPAGTISGSSQIDYAYIGLAFEPIASTSNPLVSGSSQIDLTSTTNYVSGIKDRLNAETVISSSAQVSITESQISDLQSYVTITSAQALGSASDVLELSGNNLVLTRGDGSTDTVDLSAFLDEDARAIASGTLNGATGIVTFTRDDSTTFELDLSDLLDDTNLVTSVAGKNGVVTLDTDDISEGSTNLYYTDARVKAKLNSESVISGSAQVSLTTDEVSEGSTNLYFTDARVVAALPTGTVSGSGQITITESQISDLDHYTDDDVKVKMNADLVVSGSQAQVLTFLGVENGATADQDASEIKSLYESNSNTNAFTDAEKTKLAGISSNANEYVHPTYDGDDISLNTSGAQVIDTLTITSDTSGHITDASVTTRNLTLANLGFTGDSNAEVNQNAFSNITVGATTVAADGKTDTLTLVGSGATTISADASTDTITISSVNTTYSIGDGGLTQNNFTDTLKTKLDGIATEANKYVHPSYTARSINTSGAQVLDILTTDTSGHVTAASARTMTLADLGYTGDSDANKYVHPSYTARSIDTSGAYVLDTFTSDASGHVTGITTRQMTLSDLGYSGTQNVKDALNTNLGTLTIGDSDDTISIPGNLTVSGTTNFVNSQTLNIGDNNIVLNADVTGTPTSNGGITIERGTATNASLIWDEGNDYWKAGLVGAEVQLALVNGTYSGLRAQATTKADVGLSNVENTALSSWAGSTNITTLGTIGTGTWNASTISIAKGGTGATTAAAAATNLGLGTGDTPTFAGINSSGNLIPTVDNAGEVGTAANTWSNGRFTNFQVDSTLTVRSYVDLADSDGIRWGSSDDYRMFYNGTTNYMHFEMEAANNGLLYTDNGTTRFTFAKNGDFSATGDIVAYASSDERLKKNIEIISNPIEKVQALRGVTWNWKDEASDVTKTSPTIGVIAQDVEKVLPELVHDRDNGYKGVDYGKMVGLLIEAIKDQQKQIDDLKSRLQ